MKKIFFLLFFSFPVFAQTPLQFSKKFSTQKLQTSFSDTIKILAIMVQFQQDNENTTTGNGHFDLSTNPQKIIDAPPRDSAYFANHLLFAKNYYTKSSNGKQFVEATVLGNVITLSQKMQEYSPTKNANGLGNLIEESWKAADAQNPNFPFQNYNTFIIFHAGVGKDFDLRGLLGFDPTPYDLPSLYFNLNGLKKIFGENYNGVQLSNNNIITNTILLPETENRTINDNFLQFSINGLLVANIASHLGLPDLFDTKTGRTAIGRFGLMDGQSMFSFFGLFPPEPSAWEKTFLGWTTPITIPYGTTTHSIPAVGLQRENDTIYKIPISTKEYFLLENRNRDPHKNGQTITFRWNGQEIQKTFLKDEKNFNANFIDSVYGVVVDVEDFDWSLPGVIDNQNTLDGGILVWHIDENIIEKNLATNSINADSKNRGVDIEEADGSQDIGQEYGSLDPGNGTQDGSPFDFWFSENKFPEYNNEFSETTNPNSFSNTFAKSHITISNFSKSGAAMTFQTKIGDDIATPIATIKKNNLKLNNNDSPLAVDIGGNGTQEFLYTSGDSIYVLKNDFTPYLNNSTGIFSTQGGKFQPIVVNNNIIGTSDSTIFVFKNTDTDNDGLADIFIQQKLSSKITTPPSYFNGSFEWGLINGNVHALSIDGNTISEGDIFISNEPIVTLSSTLYIVDEHTLWAGNQQQTWKSTAKILAATFTKYNEENYAIIICEDNTFSVINLSTKKIITKNLNNISTSLAVADINNDGMNDIIIGSENKLYAYNLYGVLLGNFPFTISDNGKILGSPTIVKLKNSNTTAIIIGSSNGHLYAIDNKAKIFNGFPLQTGGIVSSPIIFENKLTVSSTDTSIYIWKVENLFDTEKILWENFLADNNHTNFINQQNTITPKSAQLLPKEFAYNWPNPVYDKTTNIRYYLGKPAIVKIKIFTMAGELVDELTGTGYANVDNEVQWNVSKIQSGVYFAEIKATSSNEETSVIIKIAVVK